jgi:hypothetical protein
MQKILIKQKGISLIVFASIVLLLVLSFTLKNLTGLQLNIQRKEKTAKALYEAKTALLGWSVLRGTTGSTGTPGQLPCPEDVSLIGGSNEGNAMATCNPTPLSPVVGRLPWRTLKLDNIRDGNGDQLWYALSAGFRSAPINSNTIARLSINGAPNNIVAIVFSPGEALPGQNRPLPTIALPPITANYLDLTNNDNNNSFSSNGLNGAFNDTLLTITQQELFQLIEKRILREVRGDNTQGLIKFYNKNNEYPYADTNNDGLSDFPSLNGIPSYKGTTNSDINNLFFNTSLRTILVNNQWMPLISYNANPLRQSVTLSVNTQTLLVNP